jgi:hypothetical protein
MSGRRRALPFVLSLALCGFLLGGPRGGSAQTTGPTPADGSRYLAVFLPGVYFAQLERKVELGNELASFLEAKLGPSYRLTPRVYASVEPMDADAEAGRIMLGLVESPLIASRLPALVPVSVAATSSTETRLAVLGHDTVKTLAGLRSARLVHAVVLDKPQQFFDNFVFEGLMSLGRDRLSATRDVASALSLVSLKKAEALLLYEGDEALGQNVGLHALYRTTPLPRPTVAAFDKRLSAADLARLRDALAQFQGRVHPGLRSYRPTNEAPYVALRNHMSERPRRLPELIEMVEDAVPLPLPKAPAGAASTAPLSTYAPTVQ